MKTRSSIKNRRRIISLVGIVSLIVVCASALFAAHSALFGNTRYSYAAATTEKGSLREGFDGTSLDMNCAAIKAVLKSYEQALNANDVVGIVKLYTDDAVLLPPNAPTAVGIDAVRATYTGLFQAIHLNLTFEIAEVKVVAPDWAFLRSASTGSITTLANGAQVPSSTHALSV